MTTACIISDNAGLSTRLGQILDQQGIVLASELLCGFQGLSLVEATRENSLDMIFVAAVPSSDIDLALIRQLRGDFDGPIVVVSDVPNHSTVIQTIRAGANDFVDVASDLGDEVAAILSSIRAKQSLEGSHGELVTVLPCGDPSDSNLVSANLAVLVAQSRGTCTLVDFHLRGGDLCHLLQLVPRHTVLDLLRMQEQVDRTMFEQAIVSHESGVRLLAGPELFSDIRDVRPAVGQHLIAQARATSPFVILNAEDIHHAEQARALATSDQVILTTRLNMISLRRTKQYLSFLSSNGVPADRVDVVAMGTGRSAEISPREVARALSVSEVFCVPDDQLAEMVSVNVGRPMVLEMPNSKASRSLIQLSRRITGGEHDTSASELWRGPLRAAAIAAASVLVHSK